MEAPLGFGFVLTLGIFLPDFEGILSSPNPIHLDLHSNVFPFYCKLKKFVLVFSVFPVFLGVGDGAEATEIVLLEVAILTCSKVAFLADSGVS